ncbi:HD-GYP domain-containing protein [Thiolapillus sp.]
MSSLAAAPAGQKPATGTPQNINEQLKLIYQRISRQYPFLSCISVAAPGSASENSIGLYSTSCDTMNGALLTQVLEMVSGPDDAIVVKNVHAASAEDLDITRQASDAGFHSSLGLPLIAGDRKLGYTFFAAREKDCFTPEVIEQMNVYARVIAQLLAGEHQSTDNLRSAVASILQLNNANESESPAHLRRVALYSRLIAENCAEEYQLSEDWIEHLVMFAPLHDIGKVYIPEEILMKPERLTDEEFEVVKAHTLKGRDLIDHMINCFGYHNELHYTDMLRNIITYHHEAVDGSGYPHGLKGEEIPLEARIVAAADVLDALLTRRAYKEAWSMDKTMRTLQSLAGSRLDPEFVDILARNRNELMRIRARCEQEQAS